MRVINLASTMLIFLFCSSCSGSSLTSTRNANQPGFAASPRPNISGTTERPVECSTLFLEVIKDEERARIDTGGSEPKIIRVKCGDMIMGNIKVPTDSDANGFSLLSAEKTSKGFAIAIEYGSRFHFEKKFFFDWMDNGFSLVRVESSLSDYADESSRNEPKTDVNELNPPIPLNHFSLFNYLS